MLKNDVLVVLPTGYSKSLLYQCLPLALIGTGVRLYFRVSCSHRLSIKFSDDGPSSKAKRQRDGSLHLES